jgi:hypothetical protein
VFFTNFLKIAMLQVVLDWQKIYKAVLEKAFFFIFWRFKLFLVLVFREISPIGYFKKSRILC